MVILYCFFPILWVIRIVLSKKVSVVFGKLLYLCNVNNEHFTINLIYK